jgi:hypothetical protein
MRSRVPSLHKVRTTRDTLAEVSVTWEVRVTFIDVWVSMEVIDAITEVKRSLQRSVSLSDFKVILPQAMATRNKEELLWRV